ncbi:MAG: hypothetical protein FD152_3839 [Xanthobacteraceae bacterium]|nr:MAG: hypothetical protein FD152_3839 [Xanthobacteraceae bacterium]
MRFLGLGLADAVLGVTPQQVFRWRRDAQSKAEARRPALSFVELAPTTASAPAPSMAGASCEIVVADIVLRIGSDDGEPYRRLIRATRQARASAHDSSAFAHFWRRSQLPSAKGPMG